MSRSGRRRNSKWDLKDGSNFPVENVEDDGFPREPVLSFHDKESQTGQHVSEVHDLKDKKWDLQKNVNINEECSEFFKDSMALDGDESYSLKSPGFEKRRQQRKTLSPKRNWSRPRRDRSRSWSRSRSRSPLHGSKWESSLIDRSRSRSGVANQFCKDFTSGKCRNGHRCPFLHQFDQKREDSRLPEAGLEDNRESRTRNGGALKYSTFHDTSGRQVRKTRSVECCNDFLKGKCRKGDSCRYVHHGASDWLGRDERTEVFREREKDKRNRDTSSERLSERAYLRSGDIPCRFYAAGNCRNGKHCRFSHHSETSSSVVGRSRYDGWRVDPNRNNLEMMGSNAMLDSANFNEVENEKMVASEIGVIIPSTDDGQDYRFEDEKEMLVSGAKSSKIVQSDEVELIHHGTQNMGSEFGFSESMGTGNWHGDMDDSLAWSYNINTPNTIIKEPGHISQISDCQTFSKSHVPPLEQSLTQVASSQMHPSPNEIQHIPILGEDDAHTFQCVDRNAVDVLPFTSFKQNEIISCTQPPSTSNVVGQGPLSFFPSVTESKDSEILQTGVQFPGGESKNSDDAAIAITSHALPAQNTVSNEQLAQVTNLSASLAQLLGSGQQLPQLYAALNSPSMREFAAGPPAPVTPLSAKCIQPNPSIGSHMQHNPICDSVELTKPGEANCGGSIKTEILDNLNPCKPVGDCEANESNLSSGMEAKETQKDADVEAQENVILSNMDGNGNEDEAKKSKEAKVIRAFKFALVELVKDILKPDWKDGHINKEAYKIIVKKVVDKVTSTMQGAHVPQTQEKVSQYLSFSKPKLTKLVQAYVERHQKS